MLREAVRRDIEALFNTERFESVPMLTNREAEAWGDRPPSLADFPEVRRSVVNYGVPSFSGRSSRDFDRDALAREIRSVLATFEPRLKESATQVTVNLGEKRAEDRDRGGADHDADAGAPAAAHARRSRDRAGRTSSGRPEMDRVFLEYYEDELAHIRALAAEFADMHPAVARNLSLDTAPCPDPYVERLLEGVAFLAARTRLKVDAEGSRFSRAVLDVLYPDLVAPTPAIAMAVLKPGQQVQTMLAGHVVTRGTRLVASLRPGLSTRCTYTTAQDVTLWPIEISSVSYLQDRSALAAAGIGTIGGEAGQAALRLTLARTGAAQGALAELALDRLDLHFASRAKAPALFDAIFGGCRGGRRAARGGGRAAAGCARAALVGVEDAEALMPRTRPGSRATGCCASTS